jgi:hypothetical protein
MSTRQRRLWRPPSAVLVLGGITLVLIILVVAAYHGSSQTPDSTCQEASSLVRRTADAATTARKDDLAGGTLPAAALKAVTDDGTDLTNVLQNDQSSDLGFDEKALPVTDEITQLSGDARGAPKQVLTDLNTLESDATTLVEYCDG